MSSSVAPVDLPVPGGDRDDDAYTRAESTVSAKAGRV
jgi:hypothetical protein